MVLFANRNFYFFNVMNNCKRPTISVPERAIYPYSYQHQPFYITKEKKENSLPVENMNNKDIHVSIFKLLDKPLNYHYTKKIT